MGFKPSIFGIQRGAVSAYPVVAHMNRESLREIERMIKSTGNQTIDMTTLTEGTKILFYHQIWSLSSKHIEPNELIEATIISSNEHVIRCRRKLKGPLMKVP